MKKVYCKNCRYLCKTKSYHYLSSREYCNAPEIATHLRGLIISPLILNNDNKCMYYKRKWWKFWVNGEKRRRLEGYQPKTDAGLKPDTKPKPDPKLISYAGSQSVPKRRKNEQ